MSFVRCPIARDEEVERAAGRVLRFARGVHCLGDAILEGGEALGRSLGRQQIKLGMGQSDNDFTVGGEGASQGADRAAQLDQPRQVVGGVLGDVGHHLRVELLQLAFDLLEGAEVAGHDPIDNRCDKRR